jgi:hypothetical protein
MMSFSLALANAPIFIFLLQVAISWQYKLISQGVYAVVESTSIFLSAGCLPSEHRKFNHSSPCSLWPFIGWGLHSYAQALEEAHPAKRTQPLG